MSCHECGAPIMARFEDPMVFINGEWYCSRCADELGGEEDAD